MDRSTIVFGNGLGLALDDTFFDLTTALRAAWELDPESGLSPEDKRRIVRCMDSDGSTTPPTREDHLDILQRVVSVCDFLNRVGNADVHWLSEEGQRFPESVRRYPGIAASHFHGYEGGLPDEFIDPLIEYVKKHKAHVATLNYDNLLYKEFVGRDMCNGYDGCLVDGFYRHKGFDHSNLERRFGRDFGWYLHLHGSPLFAERNPPQIVKIAQRDIAGSLHLRKHVVLTHHQFKRYVIQDSIILRSDAEYFRRALRESDHVIGFGYSGGDEHVNEVIRDERHARDFEVTVVEWEGAGERDEQMNFWAERLGGNVHLSRMQSVLEYRFDDA